MRPRLFSLVLAALLISCRAPTSVTLVLSSDVQCSDHPVTSVAVSRRSDEMLTPAKATEVCQPDGTIGTLVVVPAADQDEDLRIRVVTSVGDAACEPPTYGAGCIVSRRQLRFIAHEELTVPIAQQVDCAGVACEASTTCRKGACVAAQIDQDRCKTSPDQCGSEIAPDRPGSGGASGQGGAGQGGASGGSGQAGLGGAGGSSGAAGSSGTGGTPSLFDASPFGISASASSGYNPDKWLPQMAQIGIKWLRGYDASQSDKVLSLFEQNGVTATGILLYYGKDSPNAFPVDDLAGWTTHVKDLVTLGKGRVHHWEVWNEPPNGTSAGTPASYATLVQTADGVIKGIDPTVQTGLAAQSVNILFLDRAIKAGAKGHFDHVTFHPYEVLDLVEQGWEAQFMSIVPTARKMLAAQDPDRASAPIWFTELGMPVDGAHTQEQQAVALLKAYTMGIAQGAAHIHWFEGIDGDSGPFGLLDASGTPRISYTAMKTLIARLGVYPKYLGWVLLSGRHHAFVFETPGGKVMVAWAQPNETFTVALTSGTQAVNPMTGEVISGNTVDLTSSPLIVLNPPDSLVSDAPGNLKKPFPWGGDYSNAKAISYTPKTPAGLHPIGPETLFTIDGEQVRTVAGKAALVFTVDPNFLSYTVEPITITAEVRRNSIDTAGFNLKYESSSGEIESAPGGWFSVPSDTAWTTKTWTLTDAQFVGKWGFHFSFDSDSMQHSNYSVRKVTVSKP